MMMSDCPARLRNDGRWCLLVIVDRSDGRHVWRNDRNILKMLICLMKIICCYHRPTRLRTTRSWWGWFPCLHVYTESGPGLPPNPSYFISKLSRITSCSRLKNVQVLSCSLLQRIKFCSIWSYVC